MVSDFIEYGQYMRQSVNEKMKENKNKIEKKFENRESVKKSS